MKLKDISIIYAWDKDKGSTRSGYYEVKSGEKYDDAYPDKNGKMHYYKNVSDKEIKLLEAEEALNPASERLIAYVIDALNSKGKSVKEEKQMLAEANSLVSNIRGTSYRGEVKNFLVSTINGKTSYDEIPEDCFVGGTISIPARSFTTKEGKVINVPSKEFRSAHFLVVTKEFFSKKSNSIVTHTAKFELKKGERISDMFDSFVAEDINNRK